MYCWFCGDLSLKLRPCTCITCPPWKLSCFVFFKCVASKGQMSPSVGCDLFILSWHVVYHSSSGMDLLFFLSSLPLNGLLSCQCFDFAYCLEEISHQRSYWQLAIYFGRTRRICCRPGGDAALFSAAHTHTPSDGGGKLSGRLVSYICVGQSSGHLPVA